MLFWRKLMQFSDGPWPNVRNFSVFKYEGATVSHLRFFTIPFNLGVTSPIDPEFKVKLTNMPNLKVFQVQLLL